MKLTDILRTQHKEIYKIIGEIKPLLKKDIFEQDIFENSSLFLTFVGKLSSILTIEETTFYSNILNNEDAKIKSTAQDIKSDFDDIKKKFKAYKQNWKNISLIQDDIPGFIEETKNFTKAVSKYFEKEEYQLFSLIDSLI